MMTTTKIGSSGDAAKYYTQKDDYYSEGGQAPSQWTGKGAEMLGLAGSEVKVDQFREILDGRITTKDGEILADLSNTGNRGHVPGWELDFGAPKSFSMMAVMDERLMEAHDQTVAEVLTWIENQLCYGRLAGC